MSQQLKCILIVDDDPTLRNLYQRLLKRRGYKVLSAEDGVFALEMLKKHPEIALVVSDNEMPNMEGVALLKAIRDDASLKDMPFILRSGTLTKEIEDLVASFGATSQSKMEDVALLIQKIKELLP